MRSSTTVLKGRPFVSCLNDRTACRVDIVNVIMTVRDGGTIGKLTTATDTLFNKDGRELLSDESIGSKGSIVSPCSPSVSGFVGGGAQSRAGHQFTDSDYDWLYLRTSFGDRR